MLDVNIILDVLLNRQPYVAEAKLVWAACNEDKIKGYISSSSLQNIFYLSRLIRKRELGYSPEDAFREALNDVRVCMLTFTVVWLNEGIMQAALTNPGNDLEDALVAQCTIKLLLDGLVTRDNKFRSSGALVLSLADALAQIKQLS